MRRGHARAAVLLGGWLLLFPRPKETTENKLALDIEAPLSQWEQVGARVELARPYVGKRMSPVEMALATRQLETAADVSAARRIPPHSCAMRSVAA